MRPPARLSLERLEPRDAPAGGLDATFATSGVATADFFGRSEHAVAVATHPNGRVTVAAESTSSGLLRDSHSGDVALARYSPDGTPDASFGQGGRLLLDLGGSRDRAAAVIALSGGVTVVAGTDFFAAGRVTSAVIVKLKGAGERDFSFGFRGVARLSFLQGGCFAIDACRLSNGKLAVLLLSETPFANRYAVGVLTADGRPDETFSPDGVREIPIPGRLEVGGYASAIAASPFGRVVVCGGTGRDFIVLRLTPTGRLDARFGTGGIAVVDFGRKEGARSLDVSLGGVVTAAGENEGIDVRTRVCRLDSSGKLVGAFGDGGRVSLDVFQGAFARGFEAPVACAVDRSGRVVLLVQGRFAVRVVRLTAAGARDADFNAFDLPWSGGGLALRPGRALVCGSFLADLALARLLA